MPKNAFSNNTKLTELHLINVSPNFKANWYPLAGLNRLAKIHIEKCDISEIPMSFFESAPKLKEIYWIHDICPSNRMRLMPE